MVEQKTKPGNGNVDAFLAEIDEPQKRADAQTLVTLMQEVSGEPPVLWGNMVGFGRYHYRYDSGHEGESFLVGFAPRKSEFSIYLMGTHDADETAQRDALLARLGKHRMGKACLYVKRLGDIDIAVLRDLAVHSVGRIKAAYPQK